MQLLFSIRCNSICRIVSDNDCGIWSYWYRYQQCWYHERPILGAWSRH